MKTKSLWLLVSLLLLSTVVMATRSLASAEPGLSGQVVHLPIISSPSGPPQINLELFATIPGGDTITSIVDAGDNRLFVAERTGRIFVVQPDGTTNAVPFLDITQDVADDNWEEGLLGIAFHPNYPRTPYFYIVYTSIKHTIMLSRFSVSSSNPDVADRESEVNLLAINKPDSTSNHAYRVHNAGDLQFGPDGYLYMSVGDGGPDPWYRGGDPHNSGQGLNEMLGNILRIDVNQSGGGLAPDCGSKLYSIPPDNPFVDGKGGSCDEVWSIGFRNPYRFSFDRLTGDMYIGEVGENLREEINFQPSGSEGGLNYGWHCYEGTIDYSSVDPLITANCSPDTHYTMPIFEYDQSDNDCSVIGGYVYRGQQYPSLIGRYVFGDFCTGRLWLLNNSGSSWSRSFGDATKKFISTFGEDVNGELYLGERGGEKLGVYRLIAVP
ncbi:MAG: PQQ-dependent sugar dehydrogenase [Candidatus Promineifilaceae bacterium]